MFKQTLMILISAAAVFALVFCFSLSWNVIPGQAASIEAPGATDGSTNAPTDVEAAQSPIDSPIIQAATVVVCILFALLAIFPLFIVDRKNEGSV